MKATSQKRRLLEVQKVLRRVYEEIDHFYVKHTRYIFKKIVLKKDLKKLSKHISRVTWDAANRVA